MKGWQIIACVTFCLLLTTIATADDGWEEMSYDERWQFCYGVRTGLMAAWYTAMEQENVPMAQYFAKLSQLFDVDDLVEIMTTACRADPDMHYMRVAVWIYTGSE